MIYWVIKKNGKWSNQYVRQEMSKTSKYPLEPTRDKTGVAGFCAMGLLMFY